MENEAKQEHKHKIDGKMEKGMKRMKDRKSLWILEWRNTPLGMCGIPKISDEGHHLKRSHSHKIRPMKRAHKSHSQFVQSFLSISKFNVPIHEARHPIYRKGSLDGKVEQGWKGKREGRPKGVD